MPVDAARFLQVFRKFEQVSTTVNLERVSHSPLYLGDWSHDKTRSTTQPARAAWPRRMSGTCRIVGGPVYGRRRKPAWLAGEVSLTTLKNRPNTALLVIDVQNGVVTGTRQRDALVANVHDSQLPRPRPAGWAAGEALGSTRRLACQDS